MGLARGAPAPVPPVGRLIVRAVMVVWSEDFTDRMPFLPSARPVFSVSARQFPVPAYWAMVPAVLPCWEAPATHYEHQHTSFSEPATSSYCHPGTPKRAWQGARSMWRPNTSLSHLNGRWCLPISLIKRVASHALQHRRTKVHAANSTLPSRAWQGGCLTSYPGPSCSSNFCFLIGIARSIFSTLFTDL